MKRFTIRYFLLAVLVMSLSTLTTTTATVGQDATFASGGIGLTRSDWEAEHGSGKILEPASPLLGELYAYDDGAYIVGFQSTKPDPNDVVMYIDIDWGDAGISFTQARDAVEGLLPADAENTEAYFAPPTPGNPRALNAFSYMSASLDTVPYGGTTLAPNVLVVYHERVETISNGQQTTHEMHVTRVSIVAQIPPG